MACNLSQIAALLLPGLLKITEHYEFGYIDYRAIFGSNPAPAEEWRTIRLCEYVQPRIATAYEQVQTYQPVIENDVYCPLYPQQAARANIVCH